MPESKEAIRGVEMPASHANYGINSETMAVSGLVQRCRHFSDIAAINPELANSMAGDAIQAMRDWEAIKQEDVSEEELESEKWSMMRERHQDKMKAEQPAKPENLTIIEGPIKLDDPFKPESLIVPDDVLPQVDAPIVSVHQPVEAPVIQLGVEQVVEVSPAPAVPDSEKEATFEEFVIPAAIEVNQAAETDTPTANTLVFEQVILADELENKLEDDEPPILSESSPALESPIAIEGEIFKVADALPEDENEIATTTPPIAIAVAERLSELTEEEKAETVPLVSDIVEAIQTIILLEQTETTEPETIEVAHEELQNMVEVLFEQLGIEYESEDIEKFIALLFEPDLQPIQPEEMIIEEVDLEKEGTHEAKRSFSQAVIAVADEVGRDIRRLIGALVLKSAGASISG